MTFTLINPTIAGSFSKNYNTENADEAAKMFWEALAVNGKYISGNVPKFMFTMIENGSNELHHFTVSETLDNKNASYNIKKIDLKLSQTESNNLIKASKNAHDTALELVRNYQEGGKHKKRYEDDKDDSSSSSDSTDDDDDLDDLFKTIRLKSIAKPIVYWWYNPTVYKVENLFTPTFIPSATPCYTQLWMPMP